MRATMRDDITQTAARHTTRWYATRDWQADWHRRAPTKTNQVEEDRGRPATWYLQYSPIKDFRLHFYYSTTGDQGREVEEKVEGYGSDGADDRERKTIIRSLEEVSDGLQSSRDAQRVKESGRGQDKRWVEYWYIVYMKNTFLSM